ncbi:MAG: glycosyl transferase [Phycisphaerales bacterium]|nr:glycosyl transferase [Phycisphaerales bacterium]
MRFLMDDPEVSVVMPCLNERLTLRTCIDKAHASLREHGVSYEIVVGDNGSTDGSQEIARDAGARVVDVPTKGYGAALMGGIQAARGKYVIMGDADDSYDFSGLYPFVQALRQGNDLVMGNRFKGGIEKGAMPFLHKYLGNPGFTMLGRVFFKSPFGDFYCGLRGFNREAVLDLKLRTTGMEFAIEMVAKSTLYRLKLAEVPTTLSPDGRDRKPHLRTWRDGWRTLRFLLLYSPRWLFLFPGVLAIVLGIIGYVVAYPQLGLTINGKLLARFDVNSLLVASLFLIVGFQAILFAVFTKSFAIEEGLLPPDPKMELMWRYINLEKGLLLSAVVMFVGVAMIAWATNDWRLHHFGPLDASRSLRLVIPGSTLVAVGFQALLGSFFLSILGLRRR